MRGTRNALAEWPAPRYTRSRSRNSRTSHLEKTWFALEPVSAHRARGIHLEAAAEHGPLKTHGAALPDDGARSEEHTSELQSHSDLVCRLLLEKKKKKKKKITNTSTTNITTTPNTVQTS